VLLDFASVVVLLMVMVMVMAVAAVAVITVVKWLIVPAVKMNLAVVVICQVVMASLQ